MSNVNKILAGVTVASLVVGGAAVLTGYKAAGTAEEYEKQLVQAQEQNEALWNMISEAKGERRITRNELIVRVTTDEYAKKSLARQNRNFCNVKALQNGDVWKGQIGTDRFGHAIFSDAGYGFRAAAITIKAYEKKHGLRTLEELVGRYCQSSKKEYAAFLGKALKIPVDKPFSYTSRIHELVVAMARWESGEKVTLDYVKNI